jgi:hypothetical protein
LVNVFAVSLTLALTVLEMPWVAGFGLTVAEEVNIGGARGVAEIGDELGPVPAELDPVMT